MALLVCVIICPTSGLRAQWLIIITLFIRQLLIRADSSSWLLLCSADSTELLLMFMPCSNSANSIVSTISVADTVLI